MLTVTWTHLIVRSTPIDLFIQKNQFAFVQYCKSQALPWALRILQWTTENEVSALGGLDDLWGLVWECAEDHQHAR